MRQLGGSFGISAVNTYAARRIASHRMDLISHVTAANPLAISRINAYATYFQQKGIGLADAKMKAMNLVEVAVVKQSTMLSYEDAYFVIGMLFAIALPLLLFVTGGPKASAASKMVLSDH